MLAGGSYNRAGRLPRSDMSSVPQYSFLKDALYGTLCLALFSALKWDEWKFAMAHGLSLASAFLIVEMDTAGGNVAKYSLWFCAASCGAVIFADLVIILTLMCTFGSDSCCSPGKTTADFATTIDVCGASGPDRPILAAFAVATIAIGVMQSVSRMLTVTAVISKRGAHIATTLVYALVRLFELSWMSRVEIPGGIVAAWVLGLLLITLPSLVDLSKKLRIYKKKHKRLFLYMPLAALVTDVLALGLLFQASAPPTVRVAGKTLQVVCAALSLWQTWARLVRSRKK